MIRPPQLSRTAAAAAYLSTASTDPQTVAGPVDFTQAPTVGGSPLGGGGAASVGQPCWFAGHFFATSGVPTGAQASPSWADLDDGTTPGTDVIVAVDDDTKLEIVNDGVYIVMMTLGNIPLAVGDTSSTRCTAYYVLNDDMAGPAYYLAATVPTGDSVLNLPTLTHAFTAGDRITLGAVMMNATNPHTPGGVTASLVKIGELSPPP